ncbi:hypothetical protein BATDEDRAFT_27121 [Batrachochytrium dendrobatidis JAM81]|uniref:Mediator of RNA polymerase II transcription subunit 25 n=1 Tax=Batrachochytrium dendrobatidis (strain JAM81 / FGSC 10211) TaxID=684364 RepID=F4PA47_BATDJ|nr:uncharacterized protein BATDEDRAFT_27121 [Batrachochytrium dendrobatidis JAM81]EGF77840.1 hypothetical protein BATDEDRAFT_27121 [Batrachochytrium dendrobatidis JAM81]|eukprot:XP_006681386.1 hypothetical protein BATDEDRAFT_27121 [Batrachochytrium dendrobatidis JAM81]
MTVPIKDVVFVVDGSAAMKRYSSIFTTYIEPIVKTFTECTETAVGQTECVRLGLVVYRSYPSYSPFTVQTVVFTSDPAVFLSAYKAIDYRHGGITHNAAAEGLAVAMQLLSSSQQTKEQRVSDQHCVLVSATMINPSPCRLPCNNLYRGKTFTDLAQMLSMNSIHFSAILPFRGLTQVEDLVESINAVPAVDYAVQPSDYVKLSGLSSSNKRPTLVKENMDSTGTSAIGNLISESSSRQSKKPKLENSSSTASTPMAIQSTVVGPSVTANNSNVAADATQSDAKTLTETNLDAELIKQQQAQQQLQQQAQQQVQQQAQQQVQQQAQQQAQTASEPLHTPVVAGSKPTSTTNSGKHNQLQTNLSDKVKQTQAAFLAQQLQLQQLQQANQHMLMQGNVGMVGNTTIQQGISQPQQQLAQQQNLAFLQSQQQQHQKHIARNQAMVSTSISPNPRPANTVLQQQSLQQKLQADLENAIKQNTGQVLNSKLAEQYLMHHSQFMQDQQTQSLQQQQQNLQQQQTLQFSQMNQARPNTSQNNMFMQLVGAKQSPHVSQPLQQSQSTVLANATPNIVPNATNAIWRGQFIWNVTDHPTISAIPGGSSLCTLSAIPLRSTIPMEEFMTHIWPARLVLQTCVSLTDQTIQKIILHQQLTVVQFSVMGLASEQKGFQILIGLLSAGQFGISANFPNPNTADGVNTSAANTHGIVVVHHKGNLYGLVFVKTSIDNAIKILEGFQRQQPSQHVPQSGLPIQLQQQQLQMQQQQQAQQRVNIQQFIQNPAMFQAAMQYQQQQLGQASQLQQAQQQLGQANQLQQAQQQLGQANQLQQAQQQLGQANQLQQAMGQSPQIQASQLGMGGQINAAGGGINLQNLTPQQIAFLQQQLQQQRPNGSGGFY